MTKVQFFTDSDVSSLQQSINEWLSQHQNVQVISTNLQSVTKPDMTGNTQGIEKHVFAIVYSEVRTRGRRRTSIIEEVIPAATSASVIPEGTSLLPGVETPGSVSNIAKTA